jgi:hypothetical protein
MYDAVASKRSAVWVEQLSIAAELSRPVLRTEEAAEWSAAPVWSRASSNFRPADRPNSSIDSRVCLPNSDAVSVTVCNVAKMFLQSPGPFSSHGSETMQGTLASIAIERQASRVAGRGVPKQRALHFPAQYLHLEGRRPCRRVFSGANRQMANGVLRAYLSRTPAKVP